MTVPSLVEVFVVREAGEEGLHPRVQRLRKELKTSADWVASMLSRIDDDDVNPIIASLRKLPEAPSDQVLTIFKRVQNAVQELKVGRRKAGVPVGGAMRPDAVRASSHEQEKILKDAQLALYGMMKPAAEVSRSAKSDAGLYRKKMKGYFDDEGNFHMLGSKEEPTEGALKEGLF